MWGRGCERWDETDAVLADTRSFLFIGTAILSFILHRRIHSIRTFHVEEGEDGTQLYYTQHVPATIMREDSLKSYRAVPAATDDERESTELNEHRPLSVQAGAV